MNYIPFDHVVLLKDQEDLNGRIKTSKGSVGMVECEAEKVDGQPAYWVRFSTGYYAHSVVVLGSDLEHFDDEYQRNPG